MNNPVNKCAACGSVHVVSGQLNLLGDGVATSGFTFTELKALNSWEELYRPLRGIDVHEREPGSATLCLDCGSVGASLIVDVKEARKVLEKWGTDAVKARLAITPPAP